MAAEMYFGRPLDLPLERSAITRAGIAISCAAGFLGFIVWLVAEARRAKMRR